MKCKAFIINGIKMLLERNYKINMDKVDLEAEVDSQLNFRENWNHIKKKFVRGY